MKFPYKRVLIVSPKRLGDTIFCTPAITFLKKHRPEIELDIIALSEIAHETLKFNPYINKLIFRPRKKELAAMKGYYQIGVNLHDSDEARSLFEYLELDVIHCPPPDHNIHQAYQNLSFIGSLISEKVREKDLRLTIYPQESNFGRVKKLLRAEGVEWGRDILIGAQVGCHGIAKKGNKFWKRLRHDKVWPLEKFIELGETLQLIDQRIRLVLIGSKGERRLAKKCSNAVRNSINMVGKTSVLDLAALMDFLDVCISPDTGTLHVACARNAKTVALFGPTNIRRTGPFPSKNSVKVITAQSMDHISTSQVIESLQELGVM